MGDDLSIMRKKERKMSVRENETKGIELFTDGKVKSGDREFTRLIGGFGKGKPSITTKQIGELLQYSNGDKTANLTINRNIEHFEFGLHIVDIKNSVSDRNSVYEVLKSQGYSKQSLSNSKNIYILSEAGFLLYLKFAEGDKAITLYKQFLEDYFQTKAENQVMKKSIEDEIKKLENDRYKISGLAVFNPVQDERVEAQKKLLNLDNRIIKMQSAIDNKKIRNSLEKQARLTESKARYITQAEFGTRFNKRRLIYG